MTENELLALVASERRNSVGFDEDAVLSKARERSLEYYKGEMDDVPAMEGRSRAVSTDIADAVETILPDLVEIFTTEDVAAFLPRGEEDEEAAEQETDYVNHVLFNENDGFMILYTAMKDALLTKTGIFKVSVEEYERSDDFENKAEEEAVAALMQYGDEAMVDVKRAEDGTFSYRIVDKGKRPIVKSVAPEDFTVSQDTVSLSDTPYCAHRARWRAFELVEAGYDAEKVKALQTYGSEIDGEEQRARDTAGESDQSIGATGERRLVEVVEHYMRRDGRYTRVLTGNDEAILLEREDVSRHGFSAITPYITTHRFYGESVADRLMEIQRIRTALTRMALDNGYMALNGRTYIDMNQVNEWTISDTLNNVPNMPIRGNGPSAVTPLSSTGLNFDAFGALEYFATQGEQRTGIVRNAQGLNPDTLHDTASGAMALMSAAQKRVRLIARIFAETGIKALLLEIHATSRETASGAQKKRLRNKWVEVDPTSWGARSDMTIEIGVGASGKEAQLMMLSQGLEVMERIAAGQGGPNGPVVDWSGIYNMTKKFFEKGLGFKSVEGLLNDPAEAEPQEPQPDPAMLEVQAKTEMAQAEMEFQKQKAMADMELAQMKAQAQVELEVMKSEAKLEAERERSAASLQFEREKYAQQAQLARDKAEFEAQLARDRAQSEAEIAIMQAASQEHVALSKNRPGGDLDK